MDRATVIVALPPVGDRIYKRSSEEVPHLTLLYLGDVELSAEAVLYVQHAAKELSPFGLSVDYRGTLGVDQADVIFFEKNKWDMDRINDFRHYLLANDEIKRAYESTPQHNEYPDWVPHLTLGYPEKPAPEDDDEDGSFRFGYVDFDRIAVWTEDFAGPEFRLRYMDNAMDEVMAMSDISTAERGANAVKELFHYGKKGMRWGVTTVDKASKPTLTREKDMRVMKTKDVTVTQRKPGTYAKAKGGQRQKATDDAVKAVAARQKAKKSTTDSLTNAELKAAVERMSLEKQYAKLDSEVKRKGQGFVSRLFQNPEARAATADLLKRVKEANAEA